MKLPWKLLIIALTVVFFCCVYKPREKRVMSRENLAIALDRFPDFDDVVNLSNNGDPILLDDLPKRVAQIRAAWPKAIINCTSTLAIKRSKAYFEQLFDNGLSNLCCSCYAYTPEDYKKYQGSKLYDVVLENINYIAQLVRMENFILRDLRNFNEHYPMEHYSEKRQKFMDMLSDLKMPNIYDRDSVLPMDTCLKEGEKNHWDIPVPCHILWGYKAARCEVHANLDIVPCCLFPENEYVFGNLKNMTVEECFNSPAARYFRDCLWKKENEKIPVCKTCKCYDGKTSNVDELERIVAWEGSQLRGKKVLFWEGEAKVYRRFTNFFEGCHPIAIIVENEQERKSIDGIPLASPDILLNSEYDKTPIVVFAFAESTYKILAKLSKNYGKSHKDIWCVPPNY